MPSTVTGTQQGFTSQMEQQAWLGLWPSETSDCKNQKPLDTQGPRDGVGVSEKLNPFFLENSSQVTGRQCAMPLVCEVTAHWCARAWGIFGLTWLSCLGFRREEPQVMTSDPSKEQQRHRPHPRAMPQTPALHLEDEDASTSNPQGLWLRALRLSGDSWESRNRPEGRPLSGAGGLPSSTSPRA